MSDFKKKKKYGQNFLTSVAIPQKIVAQSEIDKSFGVLEIGAGKGILTEELAKNAAFVVAVEIDNDLIDFLKDKFAPYQNVVIINSDILQTDINEIIKKYFTGLKTAVCANIPYYITSPIIMQLLEGGYGFDFITVMVQKEVAARLLSKKGESEYGAITVVCNYYARIKKLFNVSAGCFSPPPKVDSAVIKFDLYKIPPVHPENKTLFFSLIKAAFAQRRKIFSNSIQSCLNKPFTKEEICGILTKVGFDINVRGEALDIYDFTKISDIINKHKTEDFLQ
ncbi:MAG: 16S rRNA (adenine(1518)-N(6)/adenine(1519)-N(6))-dimethyltransferase RsmA [Clostridia bacterium]